MSDETEFGSRIVEAEKRLNDEHFDAMRAVAAAADLKTENAAQRVRIAELEAELRTYDELTIQSGIRIAELEGAIKQAPCPVHVQREADKGACACCDCYGDCHQCDCWKIDVLKESDE